MRLSYSYPALVSARPPGCRSPRAVIVLLDDEVDVRELDDATAPLVAAFEWQDRSYRYRYVDGEFYATAGAIGDRSVPPGRFPVPAAEAITFDLLRGLPGDILRKENSVWPPAADKVLGDLVQVSGKGVLPGRPRLPFMDWVAQDGRLPFYDPRSLNEVDPSGLSAARDAARERAGKNFMLPGSDDIWTPVPEPMFQLSTSATNYVRVADVSLYDTPSARERLLPPPFGKGHVSNASYWRSKHAFALLSDMGSVVDHVMELNGVGLGREARRYIADAGTVEVYAPELFGRSHAERELERQARVVLVNVRANLFTGRRWSTRAPGDIRGPYEELAGLIETASPGDAPPDALGEALRAFAEAWTACVADGRVDFYGARNDMFPGLAPAIPAFDDRPISLDIELREPITPGVTP